MWQGGKVVFIHWYGLVWYRIRKGHLRRTVQLYSISKVTRSIVWDWMLGKSSSTETGTGTELAGDRRSSWDNILVQASECCWLLPGWTQVWAGQQDPVNKEGERISLNIKIIETGGNCLEVGGWRRGCVYSRKCRLSEENGKKMVYFEESGQNGYQRIGDHKASIKSNNQKNIFSKHLQLQHPDQVKDPMAYTFKIEGSYLSSIERQVREWVKITYGEADEIMNSSRIPPARSHQDCHNKRSWEIELSGAQNYFLPTRENQLGPIHSIIF